MLITAAAFALLAALLIWNVLMLTGRAYREEVFDHFPALYTSVGIAGTFVGIAIGLDGFDVADIGESLPLLLSGLKTAFYTSIGGIVLALVMGTVNRIRRAGLTRATHKGEETREAELLVRVDERIRQGFEGLGGAMSHSLESGIGELVQHLVNDQRDGFHALSRALGSEADGSLGAQLTLLRQVTREQGAEQKQALVRVTKALGGDGESSLLTQLTRMREEQNEQSRSAGRREGCGARGQVRAGVPKVRPSPTLRPTQPPLAHALTSYPDRDLYRRPPPSASRRRGGGWVGQALQRRRQALRRRRGGLHVLPHQPLER